LNLECLQLLADFIPDPFAHIRGSAAGPRSWELSPQSQDKTTAVLAQVVTARFLAMPFKNNKLLRTYDITRVGIFVLCTAFHFLISAFNRLFHCRAGTSASLLENAATVPITPSTRGEYDHLPRQTCGKSAVLPATLDGDVSLVADQAWRPRCALQDL